MLRVARSREGCIVSQLREFRLDKCGFVVFQRDRTSAVKAMDVAILPELLPLGMEDSSLCEYRTDVLL